MKNILILALCLLAISIQAQKRKKNNSEVKSALEELKTNGLKFRDIGPAITSGRISDFAVNPENDKEYYVATSSGGVWKTTNGGTTYQPVFDNEGSYSIGVITMDPKNSKVIWVGTGENNNQRSVGYGDGVYKSEDGGKSWKNMGLKTSEHIGSIIVDPENSNRIYVAAIGPLWSAGGERGLYISEDGGENWKAVLTVDEHTGVNEVVMHPEDPDILYASTFQRRRHVFTYLGGGPGSSIYKSTDRGETWTEAKKGLPDVDLGRIGFSVSPANPEIVYAIVEAAQDKGGLFVSTDRAASWEKRGDYVTSGNYYQEITADPVDPNKIYAMDTWMHISKDGGKTFKVLGEDTKHVDNHCIWIDPKDTDHLLVGCDGGIYETYDGATTWHYKANLPITQFYKVSVDNDEPFYNIYGGTQDNFSMGGPSRTISGNGIANESWYMTHGGDGFETQVDPTNPDIVYSQSQYGFLVRYDRKSGEEVGIKPQPMKGEKQYRWNWDAPLHISAHNPKRIYFAANKVFKSDDRGNSWVVISNDLTRNINRNQLSVMGRVWGIDAVRKNLSTSPYGTIVALSESPINEKLLIVGSDDGLIHITDDGGGSWRKIEGIDGVPNRTYVNALLASKHDETVIYAAFNHHKYGDFNPYLYKSSDGGNSWTNISSNLPERGSVYAIAEDHIDPDLLFAGTEFGIFFSPNGGKEWKQLKNGVPTIAVRDIAIQERENDLILGTFGRGFFVLDDYSTLRGIDKKIQNDTLYTVRDPRLYLESYPLGLPGKSFQGDNYYTGENLPPVAIITYHLKEIPKTITEKRREQEKENKEENKNNAYPSYEALKNEKTEEEPYLLFTIQNEQGNIIRKIKEEPKDGINRIHWDLRFAPDDAISFTPPPFYNPFAGKDEGNLVAPGRYSVSMALFKDGQFQEIGESVEFDVKPLNNSVLPAKDRSQKLAFQRKISELSTKVESAQKRLGEVKNQIKHIKQAIFFTEAEQKPLFDDLLNIKKQITEIDHQLNGDPIASTLDIEKVPTIANRIGMLNYEQFNTTSEPTETHKKVYKIAYEAFSPVMEKLENLISGDLANLQESLRKQGAPYTPYRIKE
ncbi:MAG TPA: glycosyl hydrolase [Cyclobacteriaceae bacterium]